MHTLLHFLYYHRIRKNGTNVQHANNFSFWILPDVDTLPTSVNFFLNHFWSDRHRSVKGKQRTLELKLMAQNFIQLPSSHLYCRRTRWTIFTWFVSWYRVVNTSGHWSQVKDLKRINLMAWSKVFSIKGALYSRLLSANRYILLILDPLIPRCSKM